MTLTEEQRERMRKNRERALEIRRKKKVEMEREENHKEHKRQEPPNGTNSNQTPSPSEETTGNCAGVSENGRAAAENDNDNAGGVTDVQAGVEVELEDFEVGASKFVSKREAKEMYCLPEGTLAICSHTERENPRQKGWTPMKLYDRGEIRARARERFGGLDGLIEERKKRAKKKFMKDLDETKNIFKRQKRS